ncbi:MAG: Phosphate regulon sensor protein [Pseudomonadota bacterium]|jgi:two-component system phosphate regulon sensor histidine kinase PhoR
MIKLILKDVWRFFWPLFIAVTLSLSLHRWWPVGVTLAVILLWQMWQKWRLAVWLERGDLLNPPHAHGLWEGYYTRLMHLFRFEQLAQKKLADIITRARNGADTLDEGVVLLSLNYGLTYFNRAASELLGLVQKDQGEKLTNLLREPNVLEYFKQEDFSKALLIPVPWNKKVLSLKVTPLAQEGFLVRVEDVTHVHKLEVLRRDFVANVSHELKTPLTVFKGSLELLQNQAQGMSASYQNLLNNMQKQSERMESLVESLLLLAKLEGQKAPVKEDFSLSALCQNLQSTFAHKAELKQQNISWNIAPNLMFHGVVDEIESAFSNLIDNAIHYSNEGGKIQVQCLARGDDIIFSVQDNGIGIDEVHIPHLTERFYRVDKSRGRDSGGTGLGLAIVKHVMQRHGGKLEITSQLGQGSRFSCVLPS